MKIVDVIKSGSSLPVVVKDANGQKWFIKLIGAGDGTYSSIIEWVANKLGLLLGLPVLKPETVKINGSENIQLLDDDGKDLWRKSTGENIAFPFILQTNKKFLFPNRNGKKSFCLIVYY
ncbi:HipA family kinase [Bacillus methanolicus]|uniref:HipA family kinase n=1 Tax=Bacillus methanolicus TaxID=1471 RepID=UPI00200EDFA1|nr:HipA family kinase [Bacillus methanolicus]